MWKSRLRQRQGAGRVFVGQPRLPGADRTRMPAF
jgi:hypothetical protein